MMKRDPIQDHLLLEETTKKEVIDKYLMHLILVSAYLERNLSILTVAGAAVLGIGSGVKLTPRQAAMLPHALVPQKYMAELKFKGYKSFEEASSHIIDVATTSLILHLIKSVRDARIMSVDITSWQLLGHTRDYGNLIAMKWAPRTYQESVRNDIGKMRLHLRELFSPEGLANRSFDDVVLRVSENHRTQRFIAERLMRTEVSALASATRQRIAMEEGIRYFKLVATLDNRTSQICRELDQMIGEWEFAEIGVDLPPFHPWCRTIAEMVDPAGYSI